MENFGASPENLPPPEKIALVEFKTVAELAKQVFENLGKLQRTAATERS
jgi:hypothetical protein